MGSGVRGASQGVGYSMMEARHGVMMLGEEFGVHLPRGITTFITSLGPVGAAMEAAFPYLAIILGATLLISHIMKIGEAEEKAAEAGKKLTDDMGEGIAKVDLQINKAAEEIRKLAGEPAWDLLSQRLRLEDAEKGYANISKLEGELKKLLESAGKTSNWNPFNWFDNSGDVTAKAKGLQEQMRGKNQTEQAGILTDALTLQSHILEQMKGQTSVSEVQLRNQQKYVDFLRQETELIQKQADAAELENQATQGKDREARMKKAEEEQNRVAAARAAGFDHAFKQWADYQKKVKEARKKAAKEAVKDAELEAGATAAVNAELRKQGEERARLTEELGRENAQHTQRMAKLQLDADIEAGKLQVTHKRNQYEQMEEIDLEAARREYEIDRRYFESEIALLDKSDKEYELKFKQLNDKKLEREKEYQNKLTQIVTRAEQERNTRILAGEKQFQDSMAQGMTQTLMGHQTFARTMVSLGDEVASGMIQNALKSIMAMNMTKEADAAHAARQGWNLGSAFGFPMGIVMAPLLATLAFASVMAFDKGGIVPGVERGDVVPAMLTPGEGVIPKSVMDGLSNAARSGNVGGGHTTHVHVRPTYNVSAIDASGFQKAVEKHTDVLERHFAKVVRKMNQ